jgi:hypothetical protein
VPRSYDDHRDDAARRGRGQSASGRDIGAIPPVADLARRERCRGSLRAFCETYAPAAFRLAWSPAHLKVITRLEEAVWHGALYAFAMPRGSGKTTICRIAALWALSYAHCRYVFVIGANHAKAEDSVDAIQVCVRWLPDYVADFPEISRAAVALGGIANRARGQLCEGLSTMIEWSRERLIFPTVPAPPNWPAAWPLRKDGMVPTSGVVLSASGLTADGIRGSVLTLTTGEVIRPDFVLLDDPQTGESAHSASQCVTRERLVSADVLGMAGPDRAISAVMPCTVVAAEDVADHLLDREKHPLWRGERTRMLEAMPADLDAWEPYFALYRADALLEPPDFSRSRAYYLEHQAELEAGAAASWPERKLPGEVSAVQHAMHLYCRDRVAFWCEYQNEPERLEAADVPQLQASEVAARVNHLRRGLVPAGAVALTAFIDVHDDLLYWAVCAWGGGFTGHLIDYGAWPDQRRGYFLKGEARPTIAQAVGVAGEEAALWAALTRLVNDLAGRRYAQDGGAALPLNRLLIDSGWRTALVYRFCVQTPHAALLLPSKGVAIRASGAPMTEWKEAPGERRGESLPWLLRAAAPARPRLVVFDANGMKSFLASRLTQPMGETGGLSLFGADPAEHRLIADHLCAEYRLATSGRGRKLEEWSIRPGAADNHWLDCLVGCAVGAALEGCALDGAGAPPRGPAPRKESWAEVQKRKQRERRNGGQ